jgi:hypothetical protein
MLSTTEWMASIVDRTYDTVDLGLMQMPMSKYDPPARKRKVAASRSYAYPGMPGLRAT